MPPGNYILKAGSLGYENQFDGGVSDISEVLPIPISNGVTEVHFSLSPKGSTQVSTDYQSEIPRSITLVGNYPNPFNPETQIVFSLPKEMTIDLQIVNLKGELIKTIFKGLLPRGENRLIWNGDNQLGHVVGSGLYLYRLRADGQLVTGKMMLMR